jgi:hypothetical protein
MENLNLEQFSPTKTELIALTEKCKGLKINGIEDREGFLAVSTRRKELKGSRVSIQKMGKSLRENAVKFQRAVIEKEKDTRSCPRMPFHGMLVKLVPSHLKCFSSAKRTSGSSLSPCVIPSATASEVQEQNPRPV